MAAEMARMAVNQPLARRGQSKRRSPRAAFDDVVALTENLKASVVSSKESAYEAQAKKTNKVIPNIEKRPSSQDSDAMARGKTRKVSVAARLLPVGNSHSSDPASATDEKASKIQLYAKLFANAGAPFMRKLETYRTSLLKCLSRLRDGNLTVAMALAVMLLPLKEVIEAMPKKTNSELMGCSYSAAFADYARNDALLCVCFLGKAKAAGAEESLEQLTAFLYSHLMRVDYLLENADCILSIEQIDARKLKPKAPRSVIRLWEALLSLSLAKDRKLRIAFSTVLYVLMKRACQDEVEIPRSLFVKHAETFLALLADPNKDMRYRCLQLLDNFQDDKVKEAMLKHLSDPAAAVRLAAVRFVEMPSDLEAAVPVLRHLIARVGDVSKDVRAGVYKKLGEVYASIPVEMCTQILCCGLAEEAQNVKNAFLQMLKAWIAECGGLVGFISDMMSQSEDLTLLEDALSLYMKETQFLSSFSLRSDSGPVSDDKVGTGGGQEDGGSGSGVANLENIQAYMQRFVTLSPAELVLVTVFYQNHALPEEVKLISVIDLISYSHFLLTTFCNMESEQERVPQRAINASADDDTEFVDAVEGDEPSALYRYSAEERDKMRGYYSNTSLVTHALRALLVIAHSHGIEDNYQVALTETMCDKVLLNGPVRSNVSRLMGDVVAQTSLGNNSYAQALPSRWLKAGFTFAATSLLRYVYARKFRLEGKFIGDDAQMEKRHFEVSITRKILSLISDIKDPFQTSGISNISVRREDLERMELGKIREFDPTGYSIEHLDAIDGKLCEQMEQTRTQQVELENVSASREGKHERAALRTQEQALGLLLQKQEAFAGVIRRHLKERWTRIMAIVEAFIGQTQSLCSEDAGLSEFPRAILLPQMTFFCSTVVKWRDQSVTDQYCDVLTSKCLGTWCMLNNGRTELWRQLNAFHVALKGALVILEGCLNQSTGDPAGLTDALRRRIEIQTLRCEMYMTTLTDLLVTNVDLQRGAVGEEPAKLELMYELKETLWGIVSSSVKTSKYVQSLAIRLGCKLLLSEFMTNRREQGAKSQTGVDAQCADDLAVLRLRGLLELAFVAPAAGRHLAADFKFTKSTRVVAITAEDKHAIVSACALYPTLSFRHLRIFHKVLEQVLMRSVHHALQLDLRMAGFAHLISFAVQTILHRSPLYFSIESFAKYFKWLLLITIDKGAALADRGGFMALISALISMFIRRNVTGLLDRFAKSPTASDDEARSMSDLCAMTNPALALLDLRDMRVLLNYIMSQGGFVRARANVRLLGELIELVSKQMTKLAKLHAGALVKAGGPVSVEPGDPLRIVFAVEDSVAFSDIVDAYDAYISSLGSRELSVMLVEADENLAAVEKKPAVASRKMTRAGRGTRMSQPDTDEEEEEEEASDGSYVETDVDDEDYVA
ncbi:reticulocyte binding 2, putative [Babesia caballi]|uniref:Reticulocyte binding 2, putative n=1 Tax=Babesia caballi TaxID=5871 RepID=A0AAV4LW93_BABCB|nr:reticulocyte binding 2, putative [Babesia caballi]